MLTARRHLFGIIRGIGIIHSRGYNFFKSILNSPGVSFIINVSEISISLLPSEAAFFTSSSFAIQISSQKNVCSNIR